MKLEQIKCSETSAYKIQTPGNYPEENIQHTEHGESLKSRRYFLLFAFVQAIHIKVLLCVIKHDTLMSYGRSGDAVMGVARFLASNHNGHYQQNL